MNKWHNMCDKIERIAESLARKRLFVIDFDDTLVSSQSSVTVEHGDGEVTILDSASFAYFRGSDGDHIDFKDFNHVTKPRLIKKGMDALKKAVADKDTRTVILTARPKGAASAVNKFMKKLGFDNVEAVALQSSDPMDKARWIEHEAGEAEEVEFTDDSSSNVKAVKSLEGKIHGKLKVNNPSHPKEEDYDGQTIQNVFESDDPTSAKVDVKKQKEPGEQEQSTQHTMSQWWQEQSKEFKHQYCQNHPDSKYCGAKAASMNESRISRIANKIMAISEVEIPIMQGLAEIAKEAKEKGIKVNGPFRVIGGVRLMLDDVSVTVVIGNSWFVKANGIVNGKSIQGKWMIPDSQGDTPTSDEVIMAVHKLSERTGFWL